MWPSWVAIAVNEDGYREVLGAAEGHERGQGQLDQLLPVAAWPWPGRRETHRWGVSALVCWRPWAKCSPEAKYPTLHRPLLP